MGFLQAFRTALLLATMVASLAAAPSVPAARPVPLAPPWHLP